MKYNKQMKCWEFSDGRLWDQDSWGISLFPSLDPAEPEWIDEIGVGYDGIVNISDNPDSYALDDDRAITTPQAIELADYMAAQWLAFKGALERGEIE